MKILFLCLMSLMLSLVITCQKQEKTIGAAIKVLEDFIKVSTELKSEDEKSKLFPFISDKMINDLKKLSNQSFKDKFLANSVKINHLSIIDFDISNEGIASIMYQISYEKISNNEPITIESEKIVEFTFSNNTWKINTVYDLSTNFIFPETTIQKNKDLSLKGPLI